jgi:hypothetical protein
MPPVARVRRAVALGIRVAVLGLLGTAAAGAQEQSLKGAAALAHPAVQAALKAIDLIKAGKVDEAYALRTKSEAADWKTMSAADRKDAAGFIAERTPSAKAFTDAVRANGELTVTGNSAVLAFMVGQDRGASYFDREDGAWRVSNGPMVFPSSRAPVDEVRVENADILTHAIGPLVLQYLDLIHAGKIDDAMKLTTSSAQAKWKTEPASEKAESLAYQKKNLPTRAAVETGLKTGNGVRGLLIVEDDKLATLNFIVSTQTPAGPNTTTFTSTTQMMGFEKENGQWRVRN